MPSHPCQRIFITGAGIVSPLGLGWRENEASLAAGRMAFRPVELFDVSQRIARTAGCVDLPQEQVFQKVPQRRRHLIDRGTVMLMLAVREALAQARLDGLHGIDAIVLGTSAGAMSVGQEYFRIARSSPARQPGQLSRLQYYQPQKQIAAIAAEFDWRGPIILVSNACASGANAIGDAMAMIQTGRARRVLAGGYDALAELVFAGFDTLRALAPDGIPRPFDAARDGLALGEGAGVMLLESADAAAERGAKALAEAAGYATATDLHHLTQPDPEGKAAIRTMTDACAMAGVSADEVDYLNSHGTGTPFNDVAEAAAIRVWAGEAAARIPVSSTKSAMGHLLGGAGAVEAIICLMALRGQWLPASLNVRVPDPAVCFDLVRNFRTAPVKVALTNSFGFGGTNATLVLTQCGHSRAFSACQPGAKRVLRIQAAGAVSPAGWDVESLSAAVQAAQPLPVHECPRPDGRPRLDWECPVHRVPPMPPERLPKFPRLRRASPVTKFAMAAALEALERAGFPYGRGAGRLGIVMTMFNGCVQFSGRFYHEVIDTPALASPLIFPETVYNAPASHLAAYLQADGPVSTLVGETSIILQAVDMAHTWLQLDLVDHCLVIGAEECDWLGAEATSYYHPDLHAGEGAGAVLLALSEKGLELRATAARSFQDEHERAACVSQIAQDISRDTVPVTLITGECGIPMLDEAGTAATASVLPAGCSHLHPRAVVGECMGAAGALHLALAAAVTARQKQPAAAIFPGSLCAAQGAVIRP